MWVVVDDRDPRIRWDGTWSARNDVGDSLGAYMGPPFLNTMHGFAGRASGNFAFSYSGTCMVSQIVDVQKGIYTSLQET